MKNALILVAGASLTVAFACGSSQDTPPATSDTDAGDTTPIDAGPDVDNGAPSTTYPAPHPPMPSLVNQAHGATLAHPKIHLVFFPGYPYEAQLTAFAQGVGATSYWGASTQEYGVGAAEYSGATELSGPDANVGSNITGDDIDAFMKAKIADGTFGTPDPETIYTIYYPQTTTITLSGGLTGASSSCSSFGGYHQDTVVDVPDAGAAQNYAYAVLPTCGTFSGLSGVDSLTGATSHEWIEAATDPFPTTNNGADSAYSSVDSDHLAWIVTGGGGEAGDLCIAADQAFFKPAGFDYMVQRTWSNLLAGAGHDPCSPDLPGVPYFQSAPVLDENVQFTAAALGGTFKTKGVVIPVGQQKTIEIDLYSDAATSGPWTVSAQDVLSAFLGGDPTMSFTFDRTQGVNGEKLHMTISMNTANTFAGGAHPFVIDSTLGGTSHERWAGLAVEK